MSPKYNCDELLEEAAAACEFSMMLQDELDNLNEEYLEEHGHEPSTGIVAIPATEDGDIDFEAVARAQRARENIDMYTRNADAAWDECQALSKKWVACCGGPEPPPPPPGDEGPEPPPGVRDADEVYPA